MWVEIPIIWISGKVGNIKKGFEWPPCNSLNRNWKELNSIILLVTYGQIYHFVKNFSLFWQPERQIEKIHVITTFQHVIRPLLKCKIASSTDCLTTLSILRLLANNSVEPHRARVHHASTRRVAFDNLLHTSLLIDSISKEKNPNPTWVKLSRKDFSTVCDAPCAHRPRMQSKPGFIASSPGNHSNLIKFVKARGFQGENR